MGGGTNLCKVGLKEYFDILENTLICFLMESQMFRLTPL